MSVIEVDNLRKEFDTPGGIEVAVDDISFAVEEGEFLTLVGPSGCGKTTTLRCIAGLETPTAGEIWFNGNEVTDVPTNKRNVAMMFQSIALYPHMTVLDNISYPLKVKHFSKEDRYERARSAAEIVRIAELVEKYPGELSGGQRQRAALARTIVQDPVAFLMDEPLSDLDAKLKVEIRKEILRVHKRLQKPTIYVTHDQEEAMTMSDRIVVMNEGDIEQIATPDEIYRRPANTFVAEFIGNPSMNFVEADVAARSSDGVSLETYGQTIDVDRNRLQEVPDTVIVGFRPQDMRLGPSEEGLTVEGTLLILEPIDDRALATLIRDEQELRAVIPSANDLEEDEPITLSVARDHLYLFHPESRASLTPAGYPLVA